MAGHNPKMHIVLLTSWKAWWERRLYNHLQMVTQTLPNWRYCPSHWAGWQARASSTKNYGSFMTMEGLWRWRRQTCDLIGSSLDSMTNAKILNAYPCKVVPKINWTSTKHENKYHQWNQRTHQNASECWLEDPFYPLCESCELLNHSSYLYSNKDCC